jgi:tetratricopeptide (TPR) repeat protein
MSHPNQSNQMSDSPNIDGREALRIFPVWLRVTAGESVSLGLNSDDAISRATRLLDEIHLIKTSEFHLDAEQAETLHALVSILRSGVPSATLLGNIEAVYGFIAALDWPHGAFGGPGEILGELAYIGWSVALVIELPEKCADWLARFGGSGSSILEASRLMFSLPSSEREAYREGFSTAQQLLAFAVILRRKLETSPAQVLAEAEYLCALLESDSQMESLVYFAGEFALIAGTASRVLSLREKCREHFDRAAKYFARGASSSANVARVDYQRLALRLEERRITEVLERVGALCERFTILRLARDAMKCRFLEALALKERGDYTSAKLILLDLKSEALAINDPYLQAHAAENLAQIHSFLGEEEAALREMAEALPLWQMLGSRVNVAKTHHGMGYLARSNGHITRAIEAFRRAQNEFAALGMVADMAAIHLVLAEMFLERERASDAETEIRAALPIIERLKLVPESIAAFSLLRESVRRRQIDRQALRKLNGYFEARKS